jgi:hypothetical protein
MILRKAFFIRIVLQIIDSFFVGFASHQHSIGHITTLLVEEDVIVCIIFQAQNGHFSRITDVP